MKPSSQFTQSTANPSRRYVRTVVWFTLAAVMVLALAVASPAAWAETNVPPGQVGGTVPPGQSPCQKGTLVARPDIAGTTTSSPVTIRPVDNDMMVPPDKKGPKQEEENDLSSTQSITLTSVASPTNGSVTWAQVGVTATVSYTPDAEFTGSDVFTYTVEDECGRSATGRIVVVVFRDDMPTLPAIITRPVGPGQGVSKTLTLPVNATLSIPAEIFAETDETNEPHYFIVTDLGQPEKALNNAPGPGKRFANVAFGLVEYRQNGPVVNPVYQVPLILEIAFDLAQGEEPTLFYWDEENNEWRSDGIQRLSYDPQTGIATFAIYHLTDFAVFADTGIAEQQFLYLPNLRASGVTGNQ